MEAPKSINERDPPKLDPVENIFRCVNDSNSLTTLSGPPFGSIMQYLAIVASSMLVINHVLAVKNLEGKLGLC